MIMVILRVTGSDGIPCFADKPRERTPVRPALTEVLGVVFWRLKRVQRHRRQRSPATQHSQDEESQ